MKQFLNAASSNILSVFLKLILFCCSVLFHFSAQAQNNKEERIEEITVIGDRSSLSMQRAVDRAQDAFYTLFNSLNDDDEFDITCSYEILLGSRVKQRLCQTDYQKAELTKTATLSSFDTPYLATARLTAKNRELSNKVLKLLESNPAFREAAMELSDRVEAYKEAFNIEARKE